MSVAAVKAILVAASLAEEGTSLFIGANSTPSGDGPMVTLIPLPGSTPKGTHNQGSTAYRRPATQVVWRARDGQLAWTKAEESWAACRKSNVAVGSEFFLFLKPVSEPHEIGPDTAQRTRIAFTVASERRT